MQYPYPASNNNNVDSTRNSVKTNNTEKQQPQQRDTKDSNGDMSHKPSRHRDTGKSDDNSSNATFATNNTQTNTKKLYRDYIIKS